MNQQKIVEQKLVSDNEQYDEEQFEAQEGQQNFVMQEAEGGWNDEWCSATMGGSCHYDNKGVCKQCHQTKEQKSLKKKSKVNKSNMGFQMQQPMQQIVMQQPMQQMVMQEAEGGWNQDWCSATMGGSCVFDTNGVCEQCKERKK